MDYILMAISVISIIIAFLSLYLAYRSLISGSRSIETLNNVRKEIEIEFDKIKFTNQETKNLITRIARLFDASEREGLEMVYPNRLEALQEFASLY